MYSDMSHCEILANDAVSKHFAARTLTRHHKKINGIKHVVNTRRPSSRIGAMQKRDRERRKLYAGT